MKMLISLAGHQKMFSKKKYLSGMKYDVKMSKKTFLQIRHGSVCLKEFFKDLFMLVRLAIKQTKVHF